MKTNKSVSKRLKLTKNGKIKRSATGGAKLKFKHRSAQKQSTKKTLDFNLNKKVKSLVLPKK